MGFALNRALALYPKRFVFVRTLTQLHGDRNQGHLFQSFYFCLKLVFLAKVLVNICCLKLQ